jgi:hypothetical protein
VGRIAFTALTNFATARYSEMRTYALSTRLLESYMRRPYSWFLNKHSAEMGRAVLTEADQVVRGSLMPALNLISQGSIAVFLIAYFSTYAVFGGRSAESALSRTDSAISLCRKRWAGSRR